MTKLFSIRGIESQLRSTEAALARQLGTLNQAYRLFIEKLLVELVVNTPQWSGDLAASWIVLAEGKSSRSGSTEATGFKSTPYVRPAPHTRGDLPALQFAIMNNADVLASIRYNTRVTIYNENPTAFKIVGQEHKLRLANFIPGDVMAIAHTISKFNHGHISLTAG